MVTSWQKQTKGKPLFPELIWSKPENQRLAGKLLIIGGNLHNVSAPSNSYNQAVDSGVGAVRIILPDSLKKTFAKVLPDCIFAPSTPSGSFAKTSLSNWLDESAWADCVLLSGDFGRNSETTVIIERFVQEYQGLLVVTQDTLQSYTKAPQGITERENTVIVGSFEQIQKITSMTPSGEGVLMYSNSLMKNIEIMADVTSRIKSHIITKHMDQIIVAVNGKISTTPSNQEVWRIPTSASAAVWWLQNPNKPFEALTSSLL